jgi:hypothetical protein
VRDCSVPDPAEPDPGSCFVYSEADCGYIPRDPDWSDWYWTTEPTLTFARDPGTAAALDEFYDDGPTPVSASVARATTDGIAERYDQNGCTDPESKTVTPEVEVT